MQRGSEKIRGVKRKGVRGMKRKRKKNKKKTEMWREKKERRDREEMAEKRRLRRINGYASQWKAMPSTLSPIQTITMRVWIIMKDQEPIPEATVSARRSPVVI